MKVGSASAERLTVPELGPTASTQILMVMECGGGICVSGTCHKSTLPVRFVKPDGTRH